MGRITPILSVSLLSALLGLGSVSAEETQKNSAVKMDLQQLESAVRDHLATVLKEIAKTERGKFLLERIAPDVRISSKPMAQLGLADQANTITLEALRLNGSMFIGVPGSAVDKTKICFTAEILSHEMLHNAQIRAGLFRYPENCSGYEAVLFEKLMELQAKDVGENMFQTVRRQPDYVDFVQQKPCLLLFLQSQSEKPEKEYLETLWRNFRASSEGRRLYREQIVEIQNWNAAYAEQAFRNNYGRFLNDGKRAGQEALTTHLAKIIAFTGMPLNAEWLISNACVQPISHGIACYENGVKVMEYEAVPEGYIKRRFSGSLKQETLIRK